MANTFERRKSKGNLLFVKKWCWWFNSQHAYCKVRDEPRSLCDAWLSLLGCFGFHWTGWKSTYGLSSLPHQTNPEGSVRLVPFTLKASSLLLIHKSQTGLVTAVISDSAQSSVLNYKPCVNKHKQKKKKTTQVPEILVLESKLEGVSYTGKWDVLSAREFLWRTAMVGLYHFCTNVDKAETENVTLILAFCHCWKSCCNFTRVEELRRIKLKPPSLYISVD